MRGKEREEGRGAGEREGEGERDENFHTKHIVFTMPDVHMHTSLSYTL